jgi:hypothetical protein
MTLPVFLRRAACVLWMFSGAVIAQTSGLYSLQGSSYTILVEFRDGALLVRETNKESLYKRVAEGKYEFFNEVNGRAYGLRVVNATTLAAYRAEPGSTAPETTLVLTRRTEAAAPAPTIANQQVPPPAPNPQVSAPTPAAAAKPLSPENEDLQLIAKDFMQRSKTDPKNAQTWAACASVALARANLSGDQFENFARQTIALIKPIMVDSSRTPCPAAIPISLWRERDGPAAERLGTSPSPAERAAQQRQDREASRRDAETEREHARQVVEARANLRATTDAYLQEMRRTREQMQQAVEERRKDCLDGRGCSASRQ